MRDSQCGHRPDSGVADLSADGTYPTTYYPNSVSIAGDGYVAGETDSGSNEIFMFAPRGSTPRSAARIADYGPVNTEAGMWAVTRRLSIITRFSWAHCQNNVRWKSKLPAHLCGFSRPRRACIT